LSEISWELNFLESQFLWLAYRLMIAISTHLLVFGPVEPLMVDCAVTRLSAAAAEVRRWFVTDFAAFFRLHLGAVNLVNFVVFQPGLREEQLRE